LGKAVTGLLVKNFTDVMDVGFTAGMEEKLDDIAEGGRQWTPVIGQFYDPFEQAIEVAMKEAERVPREQLDEPTGEVCEKCGSPLVIKSGRYGRFMACTGYPECKKTRPIESPEESAVRELVSEDVDELCDKCEKPMVVRNSRGGRFLGCSAYPECENAKPLRVGIDCEKCGGAMIERRGKGKSGRIFYGCINYPGCNHTVNPLPQPCPQCGKLLVSRGRARGNARCLDKNCGFTGPVPKQESETLEAAS
jgi:DNA topoisomerase-1